MNRDTLYIIIAVVQLVSMAISLIAGAKIMANELKSLKERIAAFEKDFLRKDTFDAWKSDIEHRIEALKRG